MPLPPDQRLFFTAAYAHPGAGIRELGILADLTPSAAHKALLRLERRGLLTSYVEEGRRYCLPVPRPRLPAAPGSKARAAVSPLQANALLTALHAPGPLTAHLLTGKNLQGRRPQIDALVRAGFLREAGQDGRWPTYLITPAGRELAECLTRLAHAQEHPA